MKFEFKTVEPAPGVAFSDWNTSTWQLRNGLSRLADFSRYFDLSEAETQALLQPTDFQVRCTPYYALLADRAHTLDPVRQMILPSLKEFSSKGQQLPDPLGRQGSRSKPDYWPIQI